MLDFGFYNLDCMEGMRQFPDNHFDLAIVDPPYGGAGEDFSNNSGTRFGAWFDKCKPTIEVERTGGTWASKYKKGIIDWDVAPGSEYFEELFRVSKNQIIWGGELLRITSDAMFSDLAQTLNLG